MLCTCVCTCDRRTVTCPVSLLWPGYFSFLFFLLKGCCLFRRGTLQCCDLRAWVCMKINYPQTIRRAFGVLLLRGLLWGKKAPFWQLYLFICLFILSLFQRCLRRCYVADALFASCRPRNGQADRSTQDNGFHEERCSTSVKLSEFAVHGSARQYAAAEK